ncbi:MAG: hypothetical protein ABR571_06685 [Jatrophihabitans sp.]|uniref:hypothetical protein n=1 Tax=Jatrophihabitans sp. TaxID=1932789 RepID=UPI00390DE9CA
MCRWRRADADRLHTIMQDPTMNQFLGLPAPYSREEAHRWVGQLGDEGGAKAAVSAAPSSRGQLQRRAALRTAQPGVRLSGALSRPTG